jgi:hypothetical protein
VQNESCAVRGEDLQQKNWYWVRRSNGRIDAYRFHALTRDPDSGNTMGQFFIGSSLAAWPLSSVLSEAQMPRIEAAEDDSTED